MVVIELNPFLETTDGCLFSWTKERHLLEGSQRTVTCTDGASPDAVGGVATTVATAVPGTEAHGEGDPLFRVRFTPERGAKSLLARDWRELLEARNVKVVAAAAVAAAPSPSTPPPPPHSPATSTAAARGSASYRFAIDEREQWLPYLSKHGYVVLKGAVAAEDVANAAALLREDLQHIKQLPGTGLLAKLSQSRGVSAMRTLPLCLWMPGRY